MIIVIGSIGAAGAWYWGNISNTSEYTSNEITKKHEKNLPKRIHGTKTMVKIPSGSFIMGDNDSAFPDAQPEHRVEINTFYIDKTPVTYADFKKYVDDGGRRSHYWKYDTYNQSNQPVTGVSWYHAVDYCNWRSERAGLEPAYKRTERLDAWNYPLWKFTPSANGYRLPTEAEFEYGARGGRAQKKFPWGDEFDPSRANYDNEQGKKTGDWWRLIGVKETPPNEYGLYGMSGNVWQWTNDWYDPQYYTSSSRNNPKGPRSGRTKVVRGGSWGSVSPNHLQVSKRSFMAPNNYNYDVGFRCVRPASSVSKDIAAQFATTTVDRSFYTYTTATHDSPLDIAPYSQKIIDRLAQFIHDYYPRSIYFQTKIDQQEVITPEKMASLIVEVSQEYSIHPLFLTGVMAAESGLGCCSFPRWYNNPMAYDWQNRRMKNGPPIYGVDRSRNRKYKDLRSAFKKFASGIDRDIYRKAAKRGLDAFHRAYVGYQAEEWMYTVSKVYKDVLGIELVAHKPARNVGKYIYLNNKSSSEEFASADYSSDSPPEDVSNKSSPEIVERLMPLSYSEPRPKEDITHIMLHFVSNVVASPSKPYNPQAVIDIFRRAGVSPHYLIGRDGTIFQLVDEERTAYHAGKGSLKKYPGYTNKMNQHSIGIELLAIGTQKEMEQYISPDIYDTLSPQHIGYTEEQYAALNRLLPNIYKRYGISADREHVIGHEEYAAGRKTDPGSLFDWSKIGL